MVSRKSTLNLFVVNNKNQSGFTLIELLTVVLLIAVIAGFAAFSLSGDPHRTMETFAKRFTQQFELLAEESALSGNDYGLLVEKDSYRYVVWNQDRWYSPQDKEIAQSQAFPETISVDLFLEEESILSLISETTLLEDSNSEDNIEQEIDPPQILILSSGEVTPFSLQLEDRGSDEVLKVDIDSFGRTSVERDE